MTKHEWTVMRDFLEAVKSEVDFDAISSQLGIAANAAEFLLRYCEAEGWDPRLPKTADGVTIVPGMKLYPLHPLPPEELGGDDDYAVVEMHATNPFGGDDIEPDELSLNYSSKEAAEAARKAGSAAGSAPGHG